MNRLIAFKGRSGLPFIFLLLVPTFLQAQLSANFYADRSGGCSPLRVSFTNQTTGASPSAIYRWDFGNGNTSALKDPGAVFTEEKTYTVSLTVTDAGKTATKTATITVYKKPTADFSAAASKVCIPAPATFTSTSTAGDGYISSYYWDFGDGQTQQGYSSSMNHYYNSEQKPTVSLTVTNNYGCYSSITKPAIVEILGRIDPVFNADKNLLCSLSDTVKFSNSSTGPGTLLYNWDFGDGTTSTQKTPAHVFTKKGVYSVKLTVSNTDGCSVAGWPVSVNAAYFNTDFTSRALCRELGFTSSSYLYPNNSLWQFGDGTTVNAYSSATHVYPAAGAYNVTLINTYSNCKDTVSKTVQVNDLVNFNSAIEAPAVICEQTTPLFKSKSNTDPSSSVWEFGDGGTYSPWKEAYHTYSTPGTYTIKLTNTFGTCKETVTKDVVVNGLPNLKGFVVDYGGVCGSPVTVQFKDTTPGAVSWQWRSDYSYNYTFSNQKTTSQTYTYDGYYYIYLTVTNAAGCSSSTSRTLSVFKPSVNISLAASSSTRGTYDCDSLRIKLTTYSNQPLKDYLWNFGDGTTSTEAQPEHFYDKPASYSISLNYTTESGCKGVTYYSVRVYGKPNAAFNHVIPCGNSLNLQFIDVSYFSDDWQWSFGDNTFAGYGSSPIHAYKDTGRYNVTFINHIGHCADTITKEVYANVLPSFVSITQAATTCDGTRGTVTFDQRSLRISGGTWNFGDGTIIPYDTSAHVITHTYTKTGTYQVTLTGTSGNCTLMDNRILRILLKQSPVLTANKTEICSNDNVDVKLTNLETNPYTGSATWGQYGISKFEHDNGVVFNGSYSNYYYDWNYTTYTTTLRSFMAGTTKMRAIITNGYTGCPDTSNYVNLKVNGPIAGFKVLTNAICYKSLYEFQDTSKTSTNTALKTWFWDFGDGKTATYSTGGNKVQHKYDNPGSYTVRLTVTDASGCVSSFSYAISVRGPKASFTASGLYVPNVPLNTTVNFYNNTVSWYSNSVDYSWQYGDGASSTGYSGSHTYTQPGTNTVRLIANDPSISCADTAYQTITVKDFNTAFSFSTFNVTNSSCPPVTVRINNLSVGYTRLVWDFGDGTTSDQYYPAHTYYKPGVYKIVLYTYGYNGLTGTYKDSVTISQPYADMTADVLQGCTSQQVTLQAAATNTSSYAWDFGDGTINSTTAATSAHNYLTPGVYQPKLILKDANGCTSSSALPDKIIIDSLSIAIKGIPAQICDSTIINFNPDVVSVAADQAQLPLIYHWDFGTGNPADTSNVRSPQFNFNKTGTYTVRFKVSSPFGCVKETTGQVVVHKKALATITGPMELCAGGTATFTGKASTGPAEWAWTFGNGNISAVQNPQSQSYTTPNVYNVQLIVKHDGCYDTTVQQLTVHPNPVPGVTASKTLVCLGETVQLTATGGGTYVWKPATGLSNVNTASPLASPVQDTKYVVDVTNAFGCTKSDSIRLTVVKPFRLVMTTDTFVCKGSSVQLTAKGANSYQWINTTNGLNNTQVGNPVAAPQNNTSYTVVGSDAYNCFKDTAVVNVVVQPLPTVTAEPDIEMLAAETHQLQATASSDVVTWRWSPDTYLSCSACPSPLVTPRMPMDYVITVKNRWGCSASDTVSIKLQCADNFVFIPNSFTPNNDAKNDVFYIKGKGIGIIKSLIIYNRWGEAVFERRNFNIDDRSAGWDGKYKGVLVPAGNYVYFAEMQCDAGQPILRKGSVTVVY